LKVKIGCCRSRHNARICEGTRIEGCIRARQDLKLTNLFRAADLKKEFENLAKQNAGH
jgi:hypothetical protein